MSLCTLCRCQELNWSQRDNWVFMSEGSEWLGCPKKRGEETPECRISEIHWHAWVRSPEAVGSCQLKVWPFIFSCLQMKWSSFCSLCAAGHTLPTESVSIWYWFQEMNYAAFLNGFFKSPGSAASSCKFACPMGSKSKISMLPWYGKQCWGIAERTAVYPKILPVTIQLYRCASFSFVNPWRGTSS